MVSLESSHRLETLYETEKVFMAMTIRKGNSTIEETALGVFTRSSTRNPSGS